MGLFNCLHRLNHRKRTPTQGFTLLEVMVVMVIVAVLMGIGTPSWIQFSQKRQVTSAREALHQAVRMAQTRSITNRQSWRFSLREQDGNWEWAVHANEQAAIDVGFWSPLDDNVKIDDSDTTLAQSGGIYYVRFGYQGEVIHRLSTITVTHKSGTGHDRCVVVSTLLGATRKGEEQLYPNGNGRYCY
jgi:prepilin-type N-terminal cleavage/methylation domain-containing protein